MEKHVNVPRLRFPEFIDIWENKKLGEISDVSKLAGYEYTKHVIYQDTGSIIALRALNIKKNALNLSEVKYIDKSDFSKLQRSKLFVGDLMFTYIGANIGDVALIDENDRFYLAPNVARIRANKYCLDYYFLLQYFNLSFFLKQEIHGYIASSSQPALSMENIRKFQIRLPSLLEQARISTFMISVDKKKYQLEVKKSLLERYKKGIMQQLFSQELRFKDDDGNDFADWKKKELGEIGAAYSGLTGKSKEDFGSGRPYIQYKQIFDDSRIDISRFEYVEIGSNENQNEVKFGDAFFTVSSETPNEVGMASVLLDEIENLYLNSFCFGYRASKDFLSPYFSRYLFHNELFRKDVIVLAQGSTRFNISKTQFMKLVVTLPSLPEQTKIASFLTSLDDKIAQTALQIEKMQLWKKGLLQQMFV